MFSIHYSAIPESTFLPPTSLSTAFYCFHSRFHYLGVFQDVFLAPQVLSSMSLLRKKSNSFFFRLVSCFLISPQYFLLNFLSFVPLPFFIFRDTLNKYSNRFHFHVFFFPILYFNFPLSLRRLHSMCSFPLPFRPLLPRRHPRPRHDPFIHGLLPRVSFLPPLSSFPLRISWPFYPSNL